VNAVALEASSRLDGGELGLVWDPAALARAERGRDAMIAALASSQYGVVSPAQLLAAGIGPGAIATRMKRHGLIPLHRGVYAVGHTALVPLAREAAALLLIVEIDGFRFHSTRSAFERDRRRDAELAAAGFRVLRVTWRQLRDEPFAVIARLAAALAV
jgi:REase_MTES_1575/Transcriptional regulator, AbiEi antitoxin